MSADQRLDALTEAIAALANDPDRADLERAALASIEQGRDVRAKYAEQLGADLLAIRTQRQALADIEASRESVLARVMPSSTLDFPGLHLERKGGRDRKEWNHDGLLPALAENFATDTETGEYDPTLTPLYCDAVRHYLRAAQVTGYRTTTGLKPLGIDPDAFCKSEPGRRTVHVTGGEAA